MNNIEIRKVRSLDELNHVMNIRLSVFVKEQHIPLKFELEKDNYLFKHYLLFYNDIPVATARMRFVDSTYIVGRVAVLKNYRNNSIGLQLMKKLEIFAKGYKIIVHAQQSAILFYKKLGYHITSNIYYEADIPHYTMEKFICD